MLVKVMPIYATFGVALVLGTVMALLVGLVTLRISGMFFVIFGFGLSELMRELLVWWEINQTHTMGRYVFVPFDTTLIYLHLLGWRCWCSWWAGCCGARGSASRCW